MCLHGSARESMYGQVQKALTVLPARIAFLRRTTQLSSGGGRECGTGAAPPRAAPPRAENLAETARLVIETRLLQARRLGAKP